MSKQVDVYIKPTCPFCIRAVALLAARGYEHNVINVSMDRSVLDALNPPTRTVPQIFIDGVAIGGFDNLYKLDADGDLAQLMRN